jgi:hypothetical protein
MKMLNLKKSLKPVSEAALLAVVGGAYSPYGCCGDDAGGIPLKV